MNTKQKIIHTLASISFFVIGFLSLGYFVMTSSSAQSLVYADLVVNGQLSNQQGGTYQTMSPTVELAWFIGGVTSCQLRRSDTGTIIGTYTHTASDFGQAIPARTVTVTRPSSTLANQTIPYALRCAGGNGVTIGDSLEVAYTNTSIISLPAIQAPIVNPGNETLVIPQNNFQNPVQVSATLTSPPVTNTVGTQNVVGNLVVHAVDLAIDSQLANQQGGSISVFNDHSFNLQWTAYDVASCRLHNITTNTSVGSRTYTPGTPISDSIFVIENPSASTSYSLSYRLTCFNTSGSSVGSDTVTVNVNLNTLPTNSCSVSISNFNVDQSDIYEDDSDDDVRLSWASTSSNTCNHACSLTYDGDDYPVPTNTTNYPVNNIDTDYTFVLECYQVGNTSNSVTRTRHVDFHSSGTSAQDDNPAITTLGAQQVGSNTARIRGTFDDGNCSNLETGFLFGTTSSSMTLLNGYADRSGSGTVTTDLQGLMPGTTYYYQHVGRGCSGITTTATQSFLTTGSSVGPSSQQASTSSIANISQNTTSTRMNIQSQQIKVQEISEDGERGEIQVGTFDIGVGYVPDSNVKVRGKFPSTFGDWLLIFGLLGLLAIAGKFIHEAFDESAHHHRSRY